MSRITLDMTLADAAVAMSEGNPGALTVLMQTMRKGKEIDPDSFMGDLAPTLDLDTNGIYGPDIWLLYKDVCGESVGLMLGVLRAVQLGFCSGAALRSAIAIGGEGIDPEDLLRQVQERLPAFWKDQEREKE